MTGTPAAGTRGTSMNPIGSRLRTAHASEAPPCPRCQTSMASALREPPRPDLNLRVGSPSPPRHTFKSVALRKVRRRTTLSWLKHATSRTLCLIDPTVTQHSVLIGCNRAVLMVARRTTHGTITGPVG
jgi:hypothetical protein